MVLYLLTNTVNGKKYVGITKLEAHERWVIHVKAAQRNVSYAISRAIRKYGPESFTVTILEQSESWEDLCAMEQAAIVTHNTHVVDGHGYNMTRGGDGHVGLQLSDEAKATIGRKNKERVRSPEELARLAANIPRGDAHYMRKSPPTPEALAALKAGHKRWRSAGGKLSAEGRSKQAATITGHTVSTETRQKIAASLRGNIPWNKGVETGPTGKPAWNTGKASSQIARTLTVKTRHQGRSRGILINDVEYGSIKEACIKTGFSRATLHKWLLNGKARYLEDLSYG